MIILPHKDGFPQETENLKVPKKYVARHSNATHVIFFETNQEYEEYKTIHFPKQTEEESLEE